MSARQPQLAREARRELLFDVRSQRESDVVGPAIARRFPSPLNATRSASPCHVRNSPPEATSQTLTSFSRTVASNLPSGLNTAFWPENCFAKSFPSVTCVSSGLPHSASFPSGLNPTCQRSKSRPVRLLPDPCCAISFFPVSRSRKSANGGLPPASLLPSKLNARKEQPGKLRISSCCAISQTLTPS